MISGNKDLIFDNIEILKSFLIWLVFSKMVSGYKFRVFLLMQYKNAISLFYRLMDKVV
jgi:hypothetical protein